MKKLQLFILLFPVQILNAQQIIKVHAGDHTRANAPIYVQLREPHGVNGNYQLVNTSSGRKLPVQWLDSLTMTFVSDTIFAGSANTYFLRNSGLKTKTNTMATETKGNGVLVKVEDKPVLFYHTKKAQPPAGSPLYYQKSGFIHPLYSPEGKILTDDFPVGHIHQHGIFNAWVNTVFRGTPVDFWNQHKQTGNVEHAEVISIRGGQVLTELTFRLRHLSLLHGEVLAEILKIRVYPFTDYFLFDLQSEQRNVTADTLFLNQYHYGGMAFRGSREWNPDDNKFFQNKWKIVTGEGLEDTMADQAPARWINVSGMVDGKMAGVTVFDHPSNYRYPQAVRVHPTMPYWCYVPVTKEAINILPGDFYRSRYRYLVFQGDVPVTLIKKVEKDWAAPPRVEIIKM